METMKILLVEDSQSDIESYESTMKVYQIQKGIKLETVYATTIEESLRLIDNSFDGAIVDLKLDLDGGEGNFIVKKIIETFRIPVLIFTGTPDNIDSSLKIPFRKKGEVTYGQLLDFLFGIYKTGLTKIMGGRGKIEERMNRVFWSNIFPTIETWNNIATTKDTEEPLLRYILSHLTELLGSDSEYSFPEETYIYPPVSEHIKPGSIVVKKDDDEPYLVLSPACDLAKRNGCYKTDRVLVAHIENADQRLAGLVKKANITASTDEEQKQKDIANDHLRRTVQNSMQLYYHFLPRSDFFPGGLVNFRKINTFNLKQYNETFSDPIIQVSNHFIKDIVSRFSSYYSRQGQPDFDFDALLVELKKL